LLAAAFAVPKAYVSLCYNRMNADDWLTASLPDYFFTSEEWKLWLPLAVAFFSLILLAIAGKKEIKGKFGLALSFLVFLLSAFAVVKYTFNDKNFNNITKMARAVDMADWDGVIDVAVKSDVVPTRAEVMMRNLAMIRKGVAADKMFTLVDGDAEYKAPRYQMYLMHIAGRSLYYYYGKVNYAYRWCMEDMVEYGMRPSYLEYMSLCAIVNGEKELARKYLHKLSKAPFRGAFVEKYSKYVDNPSLAENDKEMKEIRKLMNYNDLLDGDSGLLEVYLLNSFALTEGGTKEMVDISMLFNLVLKDINGFWPRFMALLPTYNGKIPVHVQEAVLLFNALEQKYDISQLPIDESVKERFAQIIQQSSNYSSYGDEYNAQALQPAFGDTYWYYYFFVKGLKTN